MAKAKLNRKPTAPYVSGLPVVVREILARTAASRRELDARAAGAAMADLKSYPVVFYPTGRPPKIPGMRAKCGELGSKRASLESEAMEIVDSRGRRDDRWDRPLRPPIAPPVLVTQADIKRMLKPKRTRVQNSNPSASP